jgi:hypothetical protein
MAYELKEYLKAINESKEDLMKSDETWVKKYPAYIINRCLSMFWDTLPQANEMNGYHFLTNNVQFQFLINIVRKKKRFGGRWLKQSKLSSLDCVKEYYGYSNEKAKEALSILSNKQIENIKETLKKGGRKK